MEKPTKKRPAKQRIKYKKQFKHRARARDYTMEEWRALPAVYE